jgi:LPS O-antigen subunit length determinant protein (WzzB/FepE family)
MEQENIQKNPYHEDEIDLIEVFKVLWKEKLLIILFTTIFAISSVLYALSLPNKYTSTSLLASANQNNSLSSKLGSYSSLAGLAGVTLPKETATSSDEAIARIKSFDFFFYALFTLYKIGRFICSKKMEF